MMKLDPWFVTGLTDGEGHFGVQTRHDYKMRIHPRYIIGLRADDRPLLIRLREFFNVGVLHYAEKKAPMHPQWFFTVSGRGACRSILRHFDAYPLQSKKGAEYPIWREIVLLPLGTPLAYQQELKARLSQLKKFAGHVDEPIVEDAQQILDLDIPCSGSDSNTLKEVK